MTALRILLARVLGLLGRRHVDGDLNEEIRTHLDLLAADHQSRGMTADEARMAARRDFGGIEPMKDTYRDGRTFRWLVDAGRDLRLGVRLLPRHPGFATGIIVTLALGIGMVTAVFTVFNAVVVRPLPMPQADRLVGIATTGAAAGPQFVFGPDFVDWRSHTRVFDRMVAFGTGFADFRNTMPAALALRVTSAREYSPVAYQSNMFLMIGATTGSGMIVRLKFR